MPTHRTSAPPSTPPVLAGRLSPFRACFSAPVWSRVLVPVAGAVLAPGKRTVSQALRVMGLAAGPGFSRYREVLNRARWDGRAVSRALLARLLDAFLPAGEVVIGVDGTIERRWGIEIKARGLYRDPVRPSRGRFVHASGLRRVSLMAVVPVPWARRRWALPFLTVLAPSERWSDERGRRHKTAGTAALPAPRQSGPKSEYYRISTGASECASVREYRLGPPDWVRSGCTLPRPPRGGPMIMGRRDFLTTAGLLLAGTSPAKRASGQSGRNGSLKETLDGALSRPVQRGDIPGVVAGVTDKNQNTYLAAFGERALGKGVPMTADSVFNIASMTKAITGTAAMQLVERGKLELDVPISKYVARAADFQVLDGLDEKGEPRLRPAKRQITLRHLMTHTSGLVYNQWDAEFDRFTKDRNFPVLASGGNDAFYPPLMFDPGDRWEYGISIDWVGLLVETISGESLGTYMQENVFGPLGMTSTGYRLLPDMEARRVATHQRGPDGKLTEVAWTGQPQPVREFGGGGLYSTVGDYLQFVRMVLNGGRGSGNQVLKPETVALMGQNAMGDTRVVVLKTTNAARSEDAEFFPGLPKSWGLTFMINERAAPTGRSAGSLAWAGLFNTFFWIDPAKGMGGVFMAQTLPFVDPRTLQAFYDFETATYQATS